MEKITSPHNPKIQLWKSLHTQKGRRASGLFLVEGIHMVEEAAKSAFPIYALLIREAQDLPVLLPAYVPVFQLSTAAFAAVADTVTPQGVMAVVGIQTLLPRGNLILLLDGLQDPGNVGTLIRTAESAGFHEVLLTAGCADPFSPKTLRSTMGSIFRVHVRKIDDGSDTLSGLHAAGYQVVGGHLHGDSFFAYHPADDRICLVIGSEGSGISPRVERLLTHRLRLPMAGQAESLNAAVAGGILMYHIAHQVLPAFSS